MPRKTKSEDPPFVRPVDLQVLLALSAGPRHGYGLIADIGEQSGGRIRLVPGNLYTVLRRLLDWGWIEESDDSDAAPSAGPPRRTYELTSSGSSALRREASRLGEVLEVMDTLGLRPGTAKG